MWILIVSTTYGDEIAAELVKHIDSKCIYNIQQACRPRKELLMPRFEMEMKIKRYTSMLRGDIPWETPSLPMPTDMPMAVKDVVVQLEKYYDAYEKGIDMEVPIDDYYIKKGTVNFFEASSWETVETVKLIEFLSQSRSRGVAKLYKKDKKTASLIHMIRFGESKLDASTSAKNISEFYRYVKQKNIPFLYVQLPNKLSSCEVELPNGMTDYSNPQVTDFLERLKNENVPFLDYRQVMKHKNIDSLDTFYRTDDHWKQTTAFDATVSVCHELERVYGFCFEADKLDINAYEQIVYPNMFLGASGREIGILYGGVDDFELFLPKYETDYSWICESKNFAKRGSAKEVLLFHPHLSWDFYDVAVYAAYGLLLRRYVKIINHKNRNGKKVLCLRDSFTSPMAMFLCPHFSEVHFIDIRQEPNSKKRAVDKHDVFRLLEEIEFDLVLMMYWPFAIMNNKDVSDVNPNTK